MSVVFNQDPYITASIIGLVLRERSVSLSPREWKHRLAGYGYAIKDTDAGQIVTDLFGKAELCMIPVEQTA